MITTSSATYDTQTGEDAYGRAFRVRRALVQLGPGPHKLDDIRIAAHMKRSTVHRILQSAIAVGVVRQIHRGMYMVADDPGHMMPSIGINAAARDALHALHEATGELVTLHAVLYIGSPRHGCVASTLGADQRLNTLMQQQDPRRLAPAPLPLGASGHAILANLPPRLLARALTGAPAVPSGRLWREQLDNTPNEIIDQGYARAVSADGWETLATPLLGGGTVTGALALTFPAGETNSPRSRSIRLQATADLVQLHLEGTASPPRRKMTPTARDILEFNQPSEPGWMELKSQ